MRATRARSRPAVLILALLAIPLLPAPLAGAALGDVVAETDEYVVTSIEGDARPLGNSSFVVGVGDNEVTAAFGLGFTTRFFGRATDLFWIGSNGFVTLHFLTPHGCCKGEPIPTPFAGPDGMIAGFWTDLDPSAGGTIRASLGPIDGMPALLVDYDQVPVKGTNGTASFQVVVFQNGDLEIRIREGVAAPGTAVTVGAENIDGTRGIQLVHRQGADLAGVGFRFTAIQTIVPPPLLEGVSPTEARVSTVVSGFGQNFVTGATILLDNASVPSFVQGPTSFLFFIPQGTAAGTYDVTIRNPDGNSSTLPNALVVVDFLRIDNFSPTTLRQGDDLSIFGGGFQDDVVLLIGGRLVDATLTSSGRIDVELPADFTPGLHDVVLHDDDQATVRAGQQLVVLGRPDLLVDEIEIERGTLGATGAPGIEKPEPWTVRVTVRNDGDAPATRLNLSLAVRGGGALASMGSSDQALFEERSSLAPGKTWTVSFTVGDGTQIGDHTFRARVRTLGEVADRDGSNDAATATESGYVRGLGGGSPDPCAVRNVCMEPEQRHHDNEVREQTDNHTAASLRILASMDDPDFDFNNFPIVFGTFEDHGDGGFTDCITWRFLGGPNGLLRVTMRADNGMSGFTDVPTAANRTSSGTVQSEAYTDLRAFGVILWETERETSAPQPSEAMTRYDFAEGVSWNVVATGLTGDFTHCSVRPASAEGHEEFTFAALPSDIGDLTPSFEGHGTAQLVTVTFKGDVRSESSSPLLPA